MSWVGPFSLVAPLSRGGMGEVWRARLGSSGTEVAIKLLMNERLVDSRFLSAFEREVRAVSGLSHPQVVRVHDFGIVSEEEAVASEGKLLSGLPWLAMELANKGSLRSHCGKLLAPEVFEILKGLLDCLSHAHARDVIHRDLKPGNVLIRRAGRVSQSMVLTDFGLAHITERGQEAEALEGGWLGTTSYMAPEQFDLDATRVGPWTDLYGLGCLAWTLICGKPPFAALGNPDAVRVAQILQEPPEFNPIVEVPEAIEHWIRRLLNKAPEDRYSWAAEAQNALDSAAKGQPLPRQIALSPSVDWRPKGVAGLSHELGALAGTGLGLVGIRAVPMIGREDERDQLWEALARAMGESRPFAVLLEGPAGCGKSRLAGWLSERADEELGAVRLKAEYGPLPGAEDGILPSVLRHWLVSEFPDSGLTAEERYTFLLDQFVAMSSHGRHGKQRRPVILWLDNLQWALDGIAFVMHVLKRREALELPLLVVMTARREALSKEPVVRSLVDAIVELPGVSSVPVEGLPQKHRGTLIREFLGLETSLAAEVERRTGGSPHFAFQLVEDWVERGLLVQGEAGFRLKEGADVALPDDIYEIWIGRIQRALEDLPTVDSIALEMAALLGHRVHTKEWEETCRKALCSPSPAFLPTLESAGLIDVEQGAGRWSFANAMVAECLVRLSKEAGRWAHHNQICAEILEGTAGDRVAERRGLHLLAAEEWEASLKPLLEAAVSRRDLSDYPVASQLLDARDEAMDRLGLPEVDRRRVHSWVDRARLARVEQKLEVADQWVKRAQRGAELGKWPDLERRANREDAYNALTRGDYAYATSLMLDTLSAAEKAGDLEIVAACELGLINSRMSRGDTSGAVVHAEKALEVYQTLGSVSGQGHAYRGLGWVRLTRGELDEARANLMVAQDHFARAGVKYGLAEVRNDLGEVHRMRGAFGVAESLYRSSIELYRTIGAAQVLTPRVNLAYAYLEQNRTTECAALLEKCLEAAKQQGRRSFEASAHLGLAVCAAKESDWDKCMAHIVWGRLTLEDSGLMSAENGRLMEQAGNLARDAGEQALAHECFDGALWHWRALDDADGLLRLQGWVTQ
ncbi:MAG: protein kinase [Myxococcota bacterium]|nr:protein kinase [Myxococcota bacterium]